MIHRTLTAQFDQAFAACPIYGTSHEEIEEQGNEFLRVYTDILRRMEYVASGGYPDTLVLRMGFHPDVPVDDFAYKAWGPVHLMGGTDAEHSRELYWMSNRDIRGWSASWELPIKHYQVMAPVKGICYASH